MGRGREVALVVGGLALALALFFHVQIGNGFTVLFGDRFDGVIEVALQQHWWNVFTGRAGWNRTGWFYPWPDTLGYNDGYFLYGIAFSLARALGADPFLATAFSHLLAKAVGFVAFYALLRRAFARGPWPSLLGALLFTIADNSLVQAEHGQLLMVGFAPVAALMLWELRRALAGARGWRVLGWGAALDLFCGAWLLSGYYMAWFFGYFMIALGLLLALLAPRGAWRALFADLRRHAGALGLVLVLAGLSIAPFLMVYLPTARQTGMHPLIDVVPYIADPLAILDIGTGNLLWGRLDAALALRLPAQFPVYSEWTSGFPPLLLACFLAGGLIAWRRRATLPGAMALAAILTWLATLRFGNFVVWPMVMALVPGARGLHTISRYPIFLAGPVVIVAGCALEHLHRRGRRALALALALALVAEEINLSPPVALDRVAELRFLAAIPPPPAGCRVFFTADPRPSRIANAAIRALYSHNVDAMLIASLDHLPTLNGYSTFNPPDWNFGSPTRADYPARVEAYARVHRLRGLCRLDLAHPRWRRHPFAGSAR